MLRKLIAKHAVPVALGAALLTFFTSLYIYDRIQVRRSIVNLEQTVLSERVARKCGESAARLVLKVMTAQKNIGSGNIQTKLEILASYEVALNLATQGDIRCLMMEEMGDALTRAYRAGLHDGQKNSYLGGV